MGNGPAGDASGRAPASRVAALFLVRAVHSGVFVVELSAILWLVVTGLIGRRDQTVAVAAGLVAAEGVVFAVGRGVCPLTPLAERLGARRGSVSDIFLPDGLARTIPIWSSTLVATAAVLHLRALARSGGRTARSRVGTPGRGGPRCAVPD